MAGRTFNLSTLLKILITSTYKDLEKNRSLLKEELQRLDIPTDDHEELIKKILKIVKITKNPKTRESHLRSYFRIYQQGINKDGRGSSIVIEITKRCDKHCIHCYSKSTGKQQDMSDALLHTLIAYARQHYKHVFITGGEPTVDERIFLVAKSNPDMLFFVFTNGSRITKDYAKRLSFFGNIIPILGIDGISSSMHDSLRGTGSYREVMAAIVALNTHYVSWGYISLITERNAQDMLSQRFIQDMIDKGAFLARYIEYLPVGSTPQKELILSGDTYYFLEKRKKEIIESGAIYIQETSQAKCRGLLYFTVDGDLKNCICFHYAKYNISSCDITSAIKQTQKEWISYNWAGECPIYADPKGLKEHLEKCGWKNLSSANESYLSDTKITTMLRRNYNDFLKIKGQRQHGHFS
jgi:MoaA/NifB/PqqE/SkfB family radical SAM enzyme